MRACSDLMGRGCFASHTQSKQPKRLKHWEGFISTKSTPNTTNTVTAFTKRSADRGRFPLMPMLKPTLSEGEKAVAEATARVASNGAQTP